MTLHEYPKVEQGSEQWHALRRGVVTASVVSRLLTSDSPEASSVCCTACGVEVGPCLSVARKKPTLLKTVHAVRSAAAATLPAVIKVADNDTSRGLTSLLVAERIAGWTEDTYTNSDMFRGVMAEPFARDIYSGHYQQATETGFMLQQEDDWQLGYSPDGLVGIDGLIEIKAPRQKQHLDVILADEVPPQYMAQCQAGLLVTGRDWLDFVSYVGGLPLYVKRVFPDPAWFAAITAACIRFEENAARMESDYLARTHGLPATDRIDFLEVI